MAYDSHGRPSHELSSAIDRSRTRIRPFTDFGSIGGTDQTATIQAALDATIGQDFAVGQAGDFLVSGLTIKDRHKLWCPGSQVTNIQSTSTSGEEQVLALDAGVVQNVLLRGFSLRGNSVSGQHGARFRAIPDTRTGILQGGLWYFEFDDIQITDFSGESWWLDGYGNAMGDPGAFLGPIQFGTHRNVRAFAGALDKRALRMSGQVGQIGFDEACEFDNGASGGGITATGENILIQRAVNADGSLNSDMAPYTILFKGVTCQGNKRGVTIERATSVRFLGGHFENLYEGILNSVSAFGNIADGIEMANVGYVGDGTGYGIRNEGGLFIARDIKFNSSGGQFCETHFVSAFGNELRLEGRNYDSTGTGAIRTSGITPAAITAAATINVAGYKHAFINGPSATAITTITDAHGPGDTLQIRANAGSIVLGSGGNIDIAPFRDPVHLISNQTATLVKNDLSGVWKLVSIGGNRGNYRPDIVIVNHAMSPYSVPAGTGTIRVDASAGNVTIKLPSIADTVMGERISVKRYDATTANTVFINGATTAENPDGQADNTVRLVDVTQAFDFERNGLQSSGGWDTIASNSAHAGTPGTVAQLTFESGNFHTTPSGDVFDGSTPMTLSLGSPTGHNISNLGSIDCSGPITVTQASGGWALQLLDTVSNVALRMNPASSSFSAFIDNTRVGSSTVFRCSVASSGDTSWLTVSGAGLPAFVGSVSVTVSASATASIRAISSSGLNGGSMSLENSTGAGGLFRNWAIVTNYNTNGAMEWLVSASEGATPFGASKMMLTKDGNLGIGTVSPSGPLSVQTPTGTNQLVIGVDANDTPYNTIAFNGLLTESTTVGIIGGGGTDPVLYYFSPTTSGLHSFRVNNAEVLRAENAQILAFRPYVVSLATGAYSLQLFDTSSNVAINLSPANSSSSVFIDNTRVGASTQFRCSVSSGADTTWLVVNGAGTAQFYGSGQGTVTIGPGLAFPFGNAMQVRYNVGSATGTVIATRHELHCSVGVTGTKQCLSANAFADHSSGTLQVMTGFSAGAQVTSTGTTTTVNGFSSGIVTVAAGTITNAFGGNISIAITSGGTITNATGLLIQDITGATTSNVAIQTGRGLVQFGDLLVCGPPSGTPNIRMGVTAASGTSGGDLWYDGSNLKFNRAGTVVTVV